MFSVLNWIKLAMEAFAEEYIRQLVPVQFREREYRLLLLPFFVLLLLLLLLFNISNRSIFFASVVASMA